MRVPAGVATPLFSEVPHDLFVDFEDKAGVRGGRCRQSCVSATRWRASGLRIAVTAQKIVSKKVLSKNLVRPTIGWLQRIPVGM